MHDFVILDDNLYLNLGVVESVKVLGGSVAVTFLSGRTEFYMGKHAERIKNILGHGDPLRVEEG